MRYVVFGTCPYPVLQVLPKLSVGCDRGALYLRGEAGVLEQAQEWGLVELAQAGGVARPTARLGLVDPGASRDIADRVQSVLTGYLEVLGEAAADLETGYRRTPACTEQGWAWDRVQHLVVGGWLMDLGFARAAAAASHPRAGAEWRVVGYAGLPLPATQCGVRLRWGTAAVLGEFWAEDRLRVPGLPLNLEPHELDVLAAVARAGEAPAGEIPPGVAGKLRYLGLLRAPGARRLKPALPVFDPPECESLEARVLGWAQALYRACRDALPPDPGAEGEVLRLAFFRGLLTAAYAAAQGVGILPIGRGGVPKGWGLWLWLEPSPQRLLGHAGEAV
ncbi:hypothetical protein Mterra_00200 [Calidithermus terrae]|uniref:Uncharacterized protein n=1 Tax=Calidithermus terrae TaxID=1408545 RepID=A0A399F4X3_9DEIN|nr:hypothetical protein [Calidithermus terrae]RIH90706.1 hypothetical protein Mterra_00200 [Calidithermus terrae]